MKKVNIILLSFVLVSMKVSAVDSWSTIQLKSESLSGYVKTSKKATSGNVYAINPDGTKKWVKNIDGTLFNKMVKTGSINAVSVMPGSVYLVKFNQAVTKVIIH